MHPPVDLARRRLLATFGVGVAATLAGARLDPQVGAQQPLRLVLLVPEDALPPDRISSVVDAVRLAIADGTATLGGTKAALQVVPVARNMAAAEHWSRTAESTQAPSVVVLALTSPELLDWLSQGRVTAHDPWILLSATKGGSVLPLPPRMLQVGRDDIAIAHTIARAPLVRTGRTLVLSARDPRSVRIERALRARMGDSTTWATVRAEPSVEAMAERLSGVRAQRLVLNVSPAAAAGWIPALRPLLRRADISVVATQWNEATLPLELQEKLAGLLWVSTWHPSMGGSERNWARRHRSLTGLVPGDAEAAAYSAAFLAVTSAGPNAATVSAGQLRQAVVRDIFVDAQRFGKDGCLPHGTQLRRLQAGRDKFGWGSQQLIAVSSPEEAFADRRT